MDQEQMMNKIIEHDNLLAKQYENIKSIIKTQEQQGRLLDTVHKMNEVQVEILTEMKYIRSDLGKVEKNFDCFKKDVDEMFDESQQEVDVKIAGVKGEIKGVSNDVDCIKEKPAKRYEQIVTKIIDIVIGFVIAGLLGLIFYGTGFGN